MYCRTAYSMISYVRNFIMIKYYSNFMSYYKMWNIDCDISLHLYPNHNFWCLILYPLILYPYIPFVPFTVNWSIFKCFWLSKLKSWQQHSFFGRPFWIACNRGIYTIRIIQHCLRNKFHQRFHGHELRGLSPNLVDPHMCNLRNRIVCYYIQTYINLVLTK